MKRHFMVSVTVDPDEMESHDPDKVIGDEILSNLESVPYVLSCEVVPVTPPDKGETHVQRAQRHR